MQLIALLTLALASAPQLNCLTSLHTFARRTVLQKVPYHTLTWPDRSTKSTISHFDVLYVLVSTGFQVLFHSPPGVLFTFPSQYYYTIGHRVIFRLGGWSPLLPTGFLVSRGTPDTAALTSISPTCLSHSSDGFPTPFGYLCK